MKTLPSIKYNAAPYMAIALVIPSFCYCNEILFGSTFFNFISLGDEIHYSSLQVRFFGRGCTPVECVLVPRFFVHVLLFDFFCAGDDDVDDEANDDDDDVLAWFLGCLGRVQLILLF